MNYSFAELNKLEGCCLELEQQVKQLENKNQPADEIVTDDELASLQLENNKLKFRIEILKRSIDEELELHKKLGVDSADVNGMESIVNKLRELFLTAITKSCPQVNNPPVLVTVAKTEKADYQCNSALPLVKLIGDKKLKGPDIAKAIIENIPPNKIISKLEAAGPGFINIIINNEYIFDKIVNSVADGLKVVHQVNTDDRIVVDYSSPNIAKEMHVGHLRSTIIGDSLTRILEFIGYQVVRINHVGDWGTQFGMLLAHLQEKYPNFLSNPPQINDLQTFYQESKKRFDEDAEFKKRSYDAVVRLQSKETEAIAAWKLVCDISRRELKQTYDILGVSPNLIERGESFYQDLMVEVVKDLESKGLLEDDEGRKVMFTGEALPPLTIVKSDGGFTYDTSDMAALKHRVEHDKANRVIYVVDQGQAQHFQILFKCGEIARYYDPKKVRLDHMEFGVVLGEDRKKFKTRSGESIRLKDLIQEGFERSLAKLKEKERDKFLSPEELKHAKEAIAIGCIKYADLSHDRKHEYVFSFDKMLDDKGNTAVYLLYALTRIRSIIRNAKLESSVDQLANQLPNRKLDLTDPREIRLAKFILKFPEIILQIVDDLYIHALCGYLYELSTVFSEFYDRCYCIVKTINESGEEVLNVNVNRIILCEATAKVIEKGLDLLGIKTVEKM